MAIQIELNGDKDECMAWLAFAKTKSYYLADYMKKAGLAQAEKNISPQPGVDIKYFKRFNMEKIIINVDSRAGGKRRIQRCVCNCNFSVGQITEVTAVDGQDFDLLNVLCCKEKESFVIYEDIIGSDFTPWELNQVVVVMAYNDFLYDCYNSNFNATGCSPTIYEGADALEDDWRTTYRVVPFCGLKIPKWVE